ncbi:hypothetical protein D3C85_1735660 [compost metagenome]
MHGGMNGVVSAAAAQIDHRGLDLRVTRFGVVFEQRRGGHDLPGLAVAALCDLMIDPGRDHPLAHVVGLDGFDGGHLTADHAGHWRDA